MNDVITPTAITTTNAAAAEHGTHMCYTYTVLTAVIHVNC